MSYSELMGAIRAYSPKGEPLDSSKLEDKNGKIVYVRDSKTVEPLEYIQVIIGNEKVDVPCNSLSDFKILKEQMHNWFMGRIVRGEPIKRDEFLSDAHFYALELFEIDEDKLCIPP